jgi:hypothetical protein
LIARHRELSRLEIFIKISASDSRTTKQIIKFADKMASTILPDLCEMRKMTIFLYEKNAFLRRFFSIQLGS